MSNHFSFMSNQLLKCGDKFSWSNKVVILSANTSHAILEAAVPTTQYMQQYTAYSNKKKQYPWHKTCDSTQHTTFEAVAAMAQKHAAIHKICTIYETTVSLAQRGSAHSTMHTECCGRAASDYMLHIYCYMVSAHAHFCCTWDTM